MSAFSALRVGPWLAGALTLAGAAKAEEPGVPASLGERIVFQADAQPNVGGLWDILNAFGKACLAEGWSEGLLERIAPEGYRIMSQDAHWWGKDEGNVAGIFVLSPTGSADGDDKAGYPVVSIGKPTEANPLGHCSIRWTRAWNDQADRESLVLNTDAWVSHVFRAARLTRPEWKRHLKDNASELVEWLAPCRGGQCRFNAISRYDDQGLDFNLSMNSVEVAPPH